MAENEVILSSGFKLPGRFFLTSRARLFEDRLVFSGWSPGSRYEEAIRMSQVRDIVWFTTVKGQPNLRIHLRDGREVYAWLKEAALWCYEVRRLAGLGKGAATIPSPGKKVADAA